MNSFLTEFLRGESIMGLGFGLCFVGVVVWKLPRIHKQVFTIRRTYAQRLRESGEEERAMKIDAETAAISRRGPIFGRLLVVLGGVVMIIGFATLI